MKKILFILLLSLISNITSAQDNWNLDFENWEDSTLIDDSFPFINLPISHVIANPYIGSLKKWSVKNGTVHQTTDNRNGKYAVVIHRAYSYVIGKLYLGNCDMNSNKPTNCTKLNITKIKKITGYYKYFEEPNSYARLYVTRFKKNALSSNMELTSKDSFNFKAIDKYTHFEMPVSNATTDSMALFFISRGSKLCEKGDYCNFLYLDNLEFEFSTTAIDIKNEYLNSVVYPNPFDESINIFEEEPVNVTLSNIQGKVLLNKIIENGRIDTSFLPSGIYFLQLKNKEQNVKCYKLVKQ